MANISGKADAINGRFPGFFQALADVGEEANGARGRIGHGEFLEAAWVIVVLHE